MRAFVESGGLALVGTVVGFVGFMILLGSDGKNGCIATVFGVTLALFGLGAAVKADLRRPEMRERYARATIAAATMAAPRATEAAELLRLERAAETAAAAYQAEVAP